MPHESCVSHPTRNWYFHMRVDYYGITNGDHCGAALLYLFEFLTGNVLEDIRSKGLSGDPWISISKRGLSDAMIGLFSERSILESRKKLQDAGFIHSRDQEFTKGACEYLFNYELVSQRIAEWDASTAGKIARRTFNTYAGKIARDIETPRAELRADTTQNCAPLSKEVIHYSQGISIEGITPFPQSEEETKTSPIPEDPQEPDQKPIHSAPPQENDICSCNYDCREHEKIDKFIRHAYKERKKLGRKLNLQDMGRNAQKIIDAEESMGASVFRTALCRYLDTEESGLRRQKWPIWIFATNPANYTGYRREATTSQDASPASIWHSVSSTLPASAPELKASEKENDFPKSALHYVDKWNTLVPESPAEVLVFTMKKLDKVRNDTDFHEKFEQIAAKTGALIRAGQPYSFAWLFSGFTPNWQGILENKFDWQLPKPTASELYEQKLLREEAGA